MEAGNREEEDHHHHRLGPAAVPSSPPYSPHRYHQQQQQHHHYDRFSPSSSSSRHQRHFSHDRDHDPATAHALAPDYDPYDDRPSQIPVASYAANNFQAAAANATIDLAGAFGNPAADPDDFYRNYRGVQTNTNITLLSSPVLEPMASAVSGSRQPSSSSRANGTGTTPKQPGAPGSRIATRPGFRSASNPVDDRSAGDGARTRSATNNGFSGGSQPSVKDLKKKFDQTTSQPATGPRKLTPRNVPKDGSSASLNGRSPILTNGQSYSALRGTATRDSGSDSTRGNASRGTQRTKFVAEDHMSNNSQSFASRISRPRTSISSNTQASKSMTHLPPSESPNPQSSPPPPPRTGGLLFGEILPEELDAVTAGYGIDVARPRRTSHSNIHKPLNTHHQRSLSDAIVEPASPTDWYRSAPVARPNEGQTPGSRIPKSHTRAHSDLAGSKTASNSGIPQHRRNADQTHAPTQTPQPPSPSRLPLSVKKLNSPSNPASPASTRSNSPANTKRPVNNARPPRAQGPPVAMNRAKTPTARSTTPTTRAKTPTHNNSSTTRKPAPNTIATPSSTRLAAYISAPPPKLSPPLRSSRPRQPVSSATTASSRLKQVDRSKSPHKPASRPPSRPASRQQDVPSTRRRKISVGPVDFAERRETIKLKYSKSIRETEARQAREAAAERRKKELEAAARAKVQAEAKAQAAAAAAAAAAAKAREHMKSADTDTSRAASPTEIPLRITTTTTVVPPSAPELQSTTNDSPTLGLPGSFPSFGSPPIGSDEAPPSAVSSTTVVTEFDGEAQTEPPVQEEALHIVQPSLSTVQPRQSVTTHEKAMYKDPFEEDGMQEEHTSIKISLEAASPQDTQQLTPTRSEFEPEPTIPGAFQDEFEPHSEYETPHYFAPQPEEEVQSRYEPEPEYEPQPYIAPAYQKTTVTILSRDPGFGPFHIEQENGALDTHNEAQEEAQKATGQHIDPLAGFYAGPHLKDNIASLRDSTLSTSETDGIDDHAVYTDPEHTPDTSNSLTVPPLMSPANRSSQHSVWTDFSIDSTESQSRSVRDSASHYPSTNFPDGRHSRPIDSRPESIREEMSFRQQPYSPDMSPLDVSDTSVHGRFPSYHEKHQELPELDTGAGFSMPYMAGTIKAHHIPQLPDHEPPPPPTVDDHHYVNESRRTSGYYDDTRPSSSLHREEQSSFTFVTSRRESEDYAHALSTPHSADQVSIDVDGVTPGLTPIDGERRSLSTGELPTKSASTDKEKNRLTQRQMVIKELIDTEAVFVRDMNVVEEIYKGTAEACPKLDSKTIKLIFRNTDEIIAFHTAFLQELKDGVSSVYVLKGRRSPMLKEDTTMSSDATTINSVASTAVSAFPSTAASSTTAVSVAGLSMTGVDTDDIKDRQCTIGPCFAKNIEKMKTAHEGFLRTSDHAAKRLIQIQEDPTVKVWLNECNEVAKDLTAAWNLDSLLIKPMQRITKYPNLISQLLQYTPADHPDREALINARMTVENAILEINKTKKNFELVGQIVGRKRKESDVKAGFAKAFGRRVDKLQASSNRPEEDPEYAKLHEKFGDDYLRLQVVLRDVEFYTRQVSAYVHEFLQYLSSIELVMRLQPGPYPELESKWVQFNVSMRDIEKVALEQHLSQVRKHVIEPFELVIKCYGNPSLAMKKRGKRRLDYEKFVQLKKGGKKIDKALSEAVEQYEALNETLKKELPKLSALTEKVGNICLGNLVNIQAKWFSIWKEKVKVVLGNPHTPEVADIVNTFHRDFKDMEDAILSIGILNPSLKGRTSQSTTDGDLSKIRSRPSDLSTRGRGLSLNSEIAPTLPTPDFVKRNSGQFALSPTATLPSPHQYYYRDYYAGINGHARGASSPISPELSAGARSAAAGSARPSTGRSYDSTGPPRPSMESAPQATAPPRRDSNSTYNSPVPGPEGRRFSGLFHSALPLADAPEESQRSSRASSRERNPSSGYNVLWLAASLFEFNIETTKHEAGYPYLTYQAGEIFDVIAEKGELWLAKNQDDPKDMVGWIWSKHFAKLADS